MVEPSDETAHPKKDAFLAAYAQCGNVTTAAKAAGCARRTHYDWLKEDPDYPARFAQAREEAAADKASDGLEPFSDEDADADFRKHLARVLTKRAVAKAAGIS